jgi:hypothetical protein
MGFSLLCEGKFVVNCYSCLCRVCIAVINSYMSCRRVFLCFSLLYSANEGPVIIQYKLLVLVYVFQKRNCVASLFPNQNYNVLSPSFHIHVSVSDLCILRIGLPILLQPILGIYKLLIDTRKVSNSIGCIVKLKYASEIYMYAVVGQC